MIGRRQPFKLSIQSIQSHEFSGRGLNFPAKSGTLLQSSSKQELGIFMSFVPNLQECCVSVTCFQSPLLFANSFCCSVSTRVLINFVSNELSGRGPNFPHADSFCRSVSNRVLINLVSNELSGHGPNFPCVSSVANSEQDCVSVVRLCF